MCCRCCGIKQRKAWVFGCGTFIALIALILGLVWPMLSVKILHSELVLKEGSTNYKNWMKAPIPMYLDIYLFDWKNPEDFKNHNIKPIFEEKGPYVFLEKHERVDLAWNSNDTISFNQTRTWDFVPEQSKGSLDDIITAANPIPATVAYMLRNNVKVVKVFANFMINEQGGTLIHKKTAREWLFNGIDDKLLTFLKKTNSSAIKIPFKKFGWFVERDGNSAFDGRFVMNTGSDDISKLGYLTRWNGKDYVDNYQGQCGKVNGTTGELWPPNLEPDSPKTIFVTDVCRYITLEPSGKIEKHGVEGVKWVGDDKVFDNGVHYSSSKCFCVEDNGKCPLAGLQDVSECKFGAPVFASYPHFYLADPSLRTSIVGMNPQKEKHELSMSLEPSTGIPLEVSARLQINLLLQPFEEYDLYRGIPRVVMPMLWFTQRAELDEDLASLAKIIINLENIGLYVAYALGAIGIIIIFIGIVLTLTKSWKRTQHDDEEPLSNS